MSSESRRIQVFTIAAQKLPMARWVQEGATRRDARLAWTHGADERFAALLALRACACLNDPRKSGGCLGNGNLPDALDGARVAPRTSALLLAAQPRAHCGATSCAAPADQLFVFSVTQTSLRAIPARLQRCAALQWRATCQPRHRQTHHACRRQQARDRIAPTPGRRRR